MMTAAQLRMARAALGWSVRDLAKKASVNANTITRIENGADSLAGTLMKIRATLEEAGVVFIPGNGLEPTVGLKKKPPSSAS